MVKAFFFIVNILLAWFCLTIFAFPVNKIDAKRESRYEREMKKELKQNKSRAFTTPPQVDKMVKESSENHLLKEIDDNTIHQKTIQQVGLTEAQQKEVDKAHARIRRRVSYSIG